MEATLSQSAAAFVALSLKAQLELAGISTVLRSVSTKELAEALEELAEEFDDNLATAAAALLKMDEAERLEALGLDLDDEKSYLAAKYGMAA